MKLLLATDGSPDATAALAAVARVFRSEGLEADLLCVVPRIHAPEPSDPRHRNAAERTKNHCTKRMESAAEHILSLALETLRAEGLEARPRTDHGSPGDVILRWSRAYDVTVVGAHDRLGRTQPGIGPVGSQVIGRCEGSIFVGRESATRATGRVLLCVDGSTSSTRALTEWVARVRLTNVEVAVMHVVELPWLRLGLDADWLDAESGNDAIALDDMMRREANLIVERARRELKQHGVSSRPVIREGLPEVQILSEAEMGEYDLIVLGATGRSDLTDVTLGSVAVRVAEYAPAAVWVVR